MCSLIKTFIGNWVILESGSLDFVVSSLWGTKTFPHYLIVENHLDLKDGSLEWPLCFLVYQGGVKKKIISREVGLKLKHFYVDEMRFLSGTTYR